MPAMQARGAVLIAGLLLLATDALAASEIFRCAAPGGGITYQQLPCPDASAGRVIDVPSQYPEIDRAARERLFQREAALDARLMKREELDAALRIAREDRLARESEALARRQAMEAPPVYFVAQPYRLPRAPLRHHSRPRPHDRPL
jgi:hypothetical protein